MGNLNPPLKPAPDKKTVSNGHTNGTIPPFSSDLLYSLARHAQAAILGPNGSTSKSKDEEKKTAGKGLGKETENLDHVQTVFSWMQKGAKALSRLGLPYLMPEIGESVLTMPKGRSVHRFKLQWRYFTWRKLLNFFLIETQLNLGITRVRGYPFEWEVDTTNICQLKCPLCHTGLDNVNRMKGVMHFDTFKKTVDEIKGHTIWLSLYSWGEPLLNKQLPRFIRYAHQSRIATVISTNLSLKLTPEKVEELVRSGLDIMIVSLDGVTQEVYEKYRVRGKLDLVLENIKLIAEKKRELGTRDPYIEWQFIVMKQNEHQIPEARRLARELGVDQIIFKKVDFPHGIGTQEMAEKWQPVNTLEFRRDSPLDKPYNEGGARCWKLWRSGVVN